MCRHSLKHRSAHTRGRVRLSPAAPATTAETGRAQGQGADLLSLSPTRLTPERTGVVRGTDPPRGRKSKRVLCHPQGTGSRTPGGTGILGGSRPPMRRWGRPHPAAPAPAGGGQRLSHGICVHVGPTAHAHVVHGAWRHAPTGAGLGDTELRGPLCPSTGRICMTSPDRPT